MNVKGLVEMNVTFMSPITPNDLKRQSLVFSYLNVEVASLDGKDHDVQVYADISAGKFQIQEKGFTQSLTWCRMGVGRS